jgi:O-6-methylguanine DNA methyltransferase
MVCEIPYGEVSTYGDIAKQMAVKMNKKCMSSQAVGGAVGHNPISIIIPCHRVVGVNGSLTGYAGGISTKLKLLELEDLICPGSFFYKRHCTLMLSAKFSEEILGDKGLETCGQGLIIMARERGLRSAKRFIANGDELTIKNCLCYANNYFKKVRQLQA